MNTLSKRFAVVMVCALAMAGLSGCNTMRGVGKDIQKGGEAVEDAAENTQDNISSSRVVGDELLAMSVKSGAAHAGGRSLKTFQVSVNCDETD